MLFGATPSDLTNWGDTTFVHYIKDQVNTPMTSHRELFRKLANPRWAFHKPEFTGHLDACAPNSTWRRQVLTTKDRRKILNVRRVDDRWEVSIDGHVRTMVRQLRFVNAVKGQKDAVVDGGSYEICSPEEEILRGIYKVKIGINCRPLVPEDVIIDFPDGYVPANSVQELIPALSQNTSWRSISSRNPEYMLTGPITTSTSAPTLAPQSPQAPSKSPLQPTIAPQAPTVALHPETRAPQSPSATPQQGTVTLVISPTEPVSRKALTSSCQLLLTSSIIDAPLFAKTTDGIWLQSDPRIDMKSIQ